MTPVLVLVAVLVVAGAVAAVAAATPRSRSSACWSRSIGRRTSPTRCRARSRSWRAARRVHARASTSSGSRSGGHRGTCRPRAPGGSARPRSPAVAFVAGCLAADRLGRRRSAAASAEGPGIGRVATALVAGSLVPRAALGRGARAGGARRSRRWCSAGTRCGSGIGLLLLLAATGLAGQRARRRGPTRSRDLALGGPHGRRRRRRSPRSSPRSVRHGGDLAIRDTLRPDAAVRHRAADDAHPAAAR